MLRVIHWVVPGMLAVLGVVGVYTYFDPYGAFDAVNSLGLESVPPAAKAVAWAMEQGFRSWFLPAAMLVAAYIIWRGTNR